MDSEGTLGRGHANGGRGLRRQRSLEWRERRGYGASAQSSSDDEDNARHAVGSVSSSSVARGARSPGQVLASILAQQYGNAGDRSYRTGSDTEGAATTDNPTPPPTLTPNHRQASPFPLESTNSRRHHYNGSISSERSRNGNDTVYAAPAKKTASGGGTLGRRTRRGHASALSSSSTASDRSETVFPDEHTRIHLTNDTGRDSPPEPAPPEVPPRGPSLHATHTLRTQQNRNGCPPNAGNFTVPSDQMPTETYSANTISEGVLIRDTRGSFLRICAAFQLIASEDFVIDDFVMQDRGTARFSPVNNRWPVNLGFGPPAARSVRAVCDFKRIAPIAA